MVIGPNDQSPLSARAWTTRQYLFARVRGPAFRCSSFCFCYSSRPGQRQAVQWGREKIDPPGEPGSAINITLPPGVSTGGISQILEESGVIPDATYEWYVCLKGAPLFQAGDYTFRIQPFGTLRILEEGPSFIEELAHSDNNPRRSYGTPDFATNRRNARNAIQWVDFETKCEYSMSYQLCAFTFCYAPVLWNLMKVFQTHTSWALTNSEDLLTQMINRFDQILTTLGYAASPQTVGLTPYETVVLASLIGAKPV